MDTQKQPMDIEGLARELSYKYQISFNEDATEQDFLLALLRMYAHGIDLGKARKNFEGIFAYELDGTVGIVYADTEKQARERVIEAYKSGGYGNDYNFSDLKIRYATSDNYYLPKYPNVLEVRE